MIVLVGDIHGYFKTFNKLVKEIPHWAEVIQVGDFGFWPGLRERYVPPPRKVYFIDGNHDHVSALVGEPNFFEPVEIWPNATYVPRGTVLTLDGKNVLFLGGARSIDRAFRRKDVGVNAWFDEEAIRQRDVLRSLMNSEGKKIDLMVTHTPPQWMVTKHFDRLDLLYWQLPTDWHDESADYVEDIWKKLDCPPLVCGHMHRSVVDGVVRILDINEVYVMED